MNILKKRLFTAVMLTGAMAATPALAGDTYFKQAPGPLSPQFREGSCIYKVIYGNFVDVPISAAGPAGSSVTSMSVYFPATDSFKRFGANGITPLPANLCP